MSSIETNEWGDKSVPFDGGRVKIDDDGRVSVLGPFTLTPDQADGLAIALIRVAAEARSDAAARVDGDKA
ncbi:hypothetical protein GS490_13530 [Rhodococcus hoagii]|nr:hypothetical protein [Prescottella equi]